LKLFAIYAALTFDVKIKEKLSVLLTLHLPTGVREIWLRFITPASIVCFWRNMDDIILLHLLHQLKYSLSCSRRMFKHH